MGQTPVGLTKVTLSIYSPYFGLSLVIRHTDERYVTESKHVFSLLFACFIFKYIVNLPIHLVAIEKPSYKLPNHVYNSGR